MITIAKNDGDLVKLTVENRFVVNGYNCLPEFTSLTTYISIEGIRDKKRKQSREDLVKRVVAAHAREFVRHLRDYANVLLEKIEQGE